MNITGIWDVLRLQLRDSLVHALVLVETVHVGE